MRHILLNLIGNAVKFTEKGFVEWTASLAPEEDGSRTLLIDVRDTGIGIAPDMRESIFDPFVQDIKNRGGKVYAGTGLGLPIVRRLVESRGGTIRVDSELGKGSTFHVRIPRVALAARPPALGDATPPSERGDIAERQGSVSAPTLHLDSSTGQRVRNLRVLLADDIPVNLRILVLHLKTLGITDCECVSSGRLALEALRRRSADIVLTDVWMPDGDGAEVARAMRADPALASIPVIAVTADNNISATFDTSAFSGILTKPITQEGLLATLAPFLPQDSSQSAQS